MIEMRWVERDAVFMSNGVVPVPTTERVLQYRTLKLRDRTFKLRAGTEGVTVATVWGDWQDVPTVVEGE